MRFRDFLFEVLRGCYLVRHPTGKINSQLGKKVYLLTLLLDHENL